MNCDHCGEYCGNARAYVDHIHDNPDHVHTTPTGSPADWNWNQIGR